MSTAISEEDESTNNLLFRVLLRVLCVIRGSFLGFVSAIGVVLLLIGLLMHEGVMAAFFGIWGMSAIIYALIGYGGLKLIKYN